MKLTSPAFSNNAFIPTLYTCDGKNLSPPLEWSEIPTGTKSLILIMDDPDAPVGTWDHWIVFNLPSNLTSLPEAITKFPVGTKLGKNSWGKIEYGGPCPPDKKHRYFFKLYALSIQLNLPPGVTKKQLEQVMSNYIIEQTQLIGLYARPWQK